MTRSVAKNTRGSQRPRSSTCERPQWLSTFGSRSKKRSRLRKRSVPPSKVLRQPWKTLRKPRHRFRFKRREQRGSLLEASIPAFLRISPSNGGRTGFKTSMHNFVGSCAASALEGAKLSRARPEIGRPVVETSSSSCRRVIANRRLAPQSCSVLQAGWS
jgi:hypothetical protein